MGPVKRTHMTVLLNIEHTKIVAEWFDHLAKTDCLRPTTGYDEAIDEFRDQLKTAIENLEACD